MPKRTFAAFASRAAKAAGHPIAFGLGLAGVVIWAMSGPFFRFSDTWELVINTGTTIITFLMVFLIQNSQNRDGAAIQAKLDELIRASAAQNRYIGIETLSEEELEELRGRCRARADRLEDASDAAEAAEDAANRKAERAKDALAGA